MDTYENSTRNVWDTYLLYTRYLSSPNHFPEKRKDKLIAGLVKIIQDCNDFSTDAPKVFHLTGQFKQKKKNNEKT
jgi:hypothetical protein